MTSDTRNRILEAVLSCIREGEAVSLDSAARRSGLTKAGLMYHFRTKRALMLGVVDMVAGRWEQALTAHLGVSIGDATATARIRAYLDFAMSGYFDETDMVIHSDPRLRQPLAERWVQQMHPWVILSADLPPALRGKLAAARLIADGAWLAGSTGVFALSSAERDQVSTVVYNFLEN